jgi:hypothetical protein
MPRENGATIMSQDFDPATTAVEILLSWTQTASGNVTVTSLCRLERLQNIAAAVQTGELSFSPIIPATIKVRQRMRMGIGWFAV